MQQHQQNKQHISKSRHASISQIVRILLFILLLLVVIVTGTLAIVTGATSTSTILSGALAIILGMVAVIQVHPIIFPSSTDLAIPDRTSSPTATNHTHSINSVQNIDSNSGQAIFQYNLPLRDPKEFYGRMAARTTLINRISNGGSSSIIGERRSGKTWLLEYLRLITPTHSMLGPTYRVGYVSATHPQCRNLANFVQRALEELKVPQSTNDLNQPPLIQLSRGVRNLRQLGIIPVLCIDEFDGFNNAQEFNNDFVDGLRALAQDDGLILIMVSKHPLREVIENLTGQTSPLFNIVLQISLSPFTEQEAHELVLNKSNEAGFNEKEREYFLLWSMLYNKNGEPYWPPLRLQLVGLMLLNDKQAAQSNSVNYQLDDPNYQREFHRRLNETYHAVVRGKS
jgi:AAA domain